MTERKPQPPVRSSPTDLPRTAARALRERLRHDEGRSRTSRLRDELEAIRKRCKAPSLLDEQTADEVLGRKEDEMPH